MQNARLEHWSIITRYANSYQAPETGRPSLNGKAYGHPRFPDGTGVDTSTIVSVDLDNMVAHTLNTVYELGEPSPDWLKWMEEKGYTLRDFHKP